MSDIDSLAGELEAALPKHAAGLHIEHNQHKGYYMTVAQTVEEDEENPKQSRYDWVSPEERQKAIDTNELWSCQWYPDTPVGFNCIAASSLPALLRALAQLST